jgi:Putative Actinobacterial Holin-X, holin superfamily III
MFLMLAPSGELLRAGMALKLNHLRRATRSYLRDRTSQATGRATSYAVAASLFAVAGLFVLAAFFVGLMALFRWVELAYGMFWAFGAVGAVLLVLAAICAGIAMAQIKKAVKEVATTIPLVPLAPGEKGHRNGGSRARANRSVQLGLMLAAVGLLGLTAARRRRHSHRLDA